MVLNKVAITRIANDVKYIIKNPLDNENIYYKHDEDNISLGYAVLIGSKDTPYEYGYYFFKFKFPDDYPYNPPVVEFLTNDGIMRFNPNLYTNGKVCLSILNTWQGESWTSCCTISSILLTLMSILNDNPLLNEPGIKDNDININKYNFLISYKNIEYSIIKQFLIIDNLDKITNNITNNDTIDSEKIIQISNINEKIFIKFKDIIIKLLKLNYDKIIKNIDNLNTIYNDIYSNKSIFVSTYSLKYKPNFNKLLYDFNNINNLIN